MSRTAAIRIVVGAVGLLLLGFGLWAFAAPASFFERVAPFPPYNRHLVHDLGAFQIGLGATLLAALAFADSLLTVLTGTGIGMLFHFWSHVLDRGRGGRETDLISLGLLALVVLLSALWRARDVIGPRPPAAPTS